MKATSEEWRTLGEMFPSIGHDPLDNCIKKIRKDFAKAFPRSFCFNHSLRSFYVSAIWRNDDEEISLFLSLSLPHTNFALFLYKTDVNRRTIMGTRLERGSGLVKFTMPKLQCRTTMVKMRETRRWHKQFTPSKKPPSLSWNLSS